MIIRKLMTQLNSKHTTSSLACECEPHQRLPLFS